MRLFNDEKGIVIPYLMVFITVIFVSLAWIICNEVLFHVGDYASNIATESFGFTYNILVILWRVTPFVILFSSVLWALVQAHRRGD